MSPVSHSSITCQSRPPHIIPPSPPQGSGSWPSQPWPGQPQPMTPNRKRAAQGCGPRTPRRRCGCSPWPRKNSCSQWPCTDGRSTCPRRHSHSPPPPQPHSRSQSPPCTRTARAPCPSPRCNLSPLCRCRSQAADTWASDGGQAPALLPVHLGSRRITVDPCSQPSLLPMGPVLLHLQHATSRLIYVHRQLEKIERGNNIP